jgi:cell division protein FtsW
MSRSGLELLLVSLVLVAIGIVMTFSASAVYASQHFQNPVYFLERQLLACGLGVIALVVLYRLGPDRLERFSRIIFLVCVFSMFLIHLPFLGHSSGGAKRWISLMGLTLQPVEFLKVAVCIYFSDYLARKNKTIERGGLLVFVTPLLFLGAVSGILLLQPDLGSVIILFLVTVLLFFLSGIRFRYILIFFALAFAALIIAVITEPYRFKRVISFLNPWQDPRGAGFQIIQSFIALGQGGVKGVGLGQGTQKLFYLPQSYSDFIFAIIGEELGLIGTALTVVLFMFFLWVGLQIAIKETDQYKRMLVCSLTYLICAQAVINILVVTGMIPTKGLALPFISYGGSSLLANLAAVGIILGVDRQREHTSL